MKYLALVADIDGTLVPISGDGSSLDQETINAVKDVSRRGIHVGLATGRGWSSTKPVVQKLGIIAPCIIEGGACIIDPQTEKIIWETSIDIEMSNRIFEIFREYAHNDELVKTSSEPARIPLREVSAPRANNRVIYLLGANKEVAIKIKEAIDRLGEPVVAHLTTPSWAGEQLYDVHVTHAFGTKQHALQEWLRRLDLVKDEIVVMGDSSNDLPLFYAGGLKVAVGNATDDLKAAADYVAPHRDEGALKDVLKSYF